jgi:1-deoxy-D-xylulose-5-phosphate synthase
MEEGWEPLEIGHGEQLADGDDLLIVAYGAMVAPAMATAGLLQEKGIRAAVVNARFLRPLDESLILPLARRIGRVVTMEEGALAGGFGAAVVESLNDHDVMVPVYRIGIPDQLVDHASPDQSKVALGLTPPQMAESILQRFALLGIPRQPLTV